MIRFDKPKTVGGFSLDKRHLANRRTMHKREWRLIFMLPFAVLMLGIMIQMLIGYAKMLPSGPAEPVIEETVLPPMGSPRLETAAALPDQSTIDAQRPAVRSLMADQATVRLESVLDATTLAWADELLRADRALPPIPQRAIARDLLLGGVRDGSAIAIRGVLVDAQDAPIAGGTRHQRLALQLDEGQYAQVLVAGDGSDLVIGRPALVSGRFLGLAPLPMDGAAATANAPLIVARSISLDEGDTGNAVDELQEMRTGVPRELPADLYDPISDERSVLETRPYYFLLGQSKIDRADPSVFAAPENDPAARNGNARAGDIHQNPDAYRGKPFTTIGYVYRVIDDTNVARDQPFGITRVQRVLCWSRDMGMVQETLDGKPVLKYQILRLYEFAIAGDMPAPKRGDKISVAGRFLKFRAIPVTPDKLRDKANDVKRQSDKVYPWVFVAFDYTLVPPPPRYEFASWHPVVILIAVGLFLLLFLSLRRDRTSEALVQGQIRKLRETRRALKDRAAATASPTTAQAPLAQVPLVQVPPVETSTNTASSSDSSSPSSSSAS